ncbi:mevalonate kinase family protein [Aureispira anguillae]|uniref:GHMP kinase N-terminal domain-containing protein n=1 Tax=Aureispira anguillae TaxID=2864201 RepID=A0A916DUF2_9BACT|nr:hypothetical protein [Aureispira anguillae]BDS13296.1 hypothetical protein AsAng_0040310 [Aureispira anguillae]
MLKTNYPSKILLLGEYTIIQKSAALAIPYFHYQSYWSDNLSIPDNFHPTIEAAFSQQSLQKILVDLKQLEVPVLNLDRLENDLKNGLWLSTNSPMGYGLGSSGAVCAAIYDRYAQTKTSDLQLLKQELALLEHSFHGKSSGIDPLIAYTHRPLWVQPDQSIHTVQLAPKSKGAIFLIDTEQPRISTPLINFFVEQCQQKNFIQNFVSPMKQAINKAITALVDAQFDELINEIGLISQLQFDFLPPMIPKPLHSIWQRGLNSKEFYLKICGAGGGGFMLGFAKDWESIAKHFKAFKVLHLL